MNDKAADILPVVPDSTFDATRPMYADGPPKGWVDYALTPTHSGSIGWRWP